MKSLSHMRGMRLLLAMLFIVASSVLCLTQENKSNGNRASATLHIQVRVVPVLMTPDHSQESRSNPLGSGMVFNSNGNPQFSVVEEDRPMAENGNPPVAILRTTTVVAR